MLGMGIISRVLGLEETRAETDAVVASPSEVPQRTIWPPTDRLGAEPRDPLSLIPIWRALQVLTTSAGQLPLTVQRQGQTVSGSRVPAHIRRPDPDMDRSDWIEQSVLSLAMDGNLFIERISGPTGDLLAARILPPAEVTITRNPRTNRIRYHHRGRELTSADLNHQTLMRLPGQLRGLGPIQAARHEITAAGDVANFAQNWFRDTGQPSGLLTAKAIRTEEQVQAIKDTWNRAARDPDNPSGIRVIGGDLTYSPLTLKPEDAQWLEVRRFTVTDFARLFGIPTSLMLASLDGNSLTYANVEQEWLSFVRFTLMSYLRKIEEAMTELSPLGQTVRFNLEGLLRSDTKSRYDAYAVALQNGWMTVDEVRDIEDLPPLTDDQRSQLETQRNHA